MTTPPPDPSVFDEPHYRGGPHRPDPSEARADDALARAAAGRHPDETVEHSVWEEPGIDPALAGTPGADELTYARWLRKRAAATPAALTWAVTLGLALVAGPWAILGALMGSGQTLWSILAIVFFAPVVEEVMKTAAVMVVVEKKPYLFRHPVQILLCLAAGALVFACVENVLYLYIRIEDPEPWIRAWRWQVCTLVHLCCTLIAGCGIVRIHRDTWRRMARPRLTLAFPWLSAAIAAHGAYNAFAVAVAVLRRQG
jgi:hypothetical protein